MVAKTCNPALKREKYKDQEFKAIPYNIMSSRTTLATSRPCLKASKQNKYKTLILKSKYSAGGCF